MSASIKTILIIGATSGIGEAFAHRFHAMGKKVIATGRRQDRLSQLQAALPGLETYVMDNADITVLPSHVDAIMKKYPDINTVWVNSGIQYLNSFKELSGSTDQRVIEEITVNVTAPTLLARHFLPHLLKHGSAANFMITTSGLAFTPIGSVNVYCATKAFNHSLMVGLRQQLKGTNVNVIEIVPPYVGPTELNSEAAQMTAASTHKPMPLEDFTKEIFDILDNNDVKDLKEVAGGSAKGRADAWRGSIGQMLEAMHLGG